MTLPGLLHTAALEHPRRTALFADEKQMSYEELDSSSTGLARWLVEQGLRPGDRMSIHWHNSFEAVVLYFAAFKAGVIAVPVNLRLKAPEIAYIFENSGACLCFSAPTVAASAQAAAASCPSVRAVLSQIPSSDSSVELPALDSAETAVIMYTSGTTARPKGARWSHDGFLVGCRCVETELIGGTTGLCMTPMMHIGALAFTIYSVYQKGSNVLLPGFDPPAVLDAIERHHCTHTFTLPALLQFVVDEQARRPRHIGSLRTVLVGGDSVSSTLHNRFQKLFGIPLQQFYGMTEGGFIAINPPNAIREGSMGRPTSITQVRIVDPAGNEVPQGEVGEIAVRGPAVCRGYWSDPKLSAELIRDGWLFTGDLATRDAEGYLWFRGRAKQIIVRAGSNVSPQEVEDALYQHPAVREVGVVGKPDAVYGELVVAFVALRGGAVADESGLREFARERLADYKTPEEIYFIPELPKGLTGKVDRRALKERLLAETGSAVSA